MATSGVWVFRRGCGGWPPGRGKRVVCPANRAEAREGPAVHTHGGAHNRWSIVIVLLFQRDGRKWPWSRAKRAEARESVAVHTQGGAHTRRYVAIASVLLFQQGCVGWPLHGAQRAICSAKRAEAREGLAVHKQGGAHTRRCTQHAVCSQRRSLANQAGVWGLAMASSEASRGKRRFGVSRTRRCTHKAAHTTGGL